MSSSEFRKRFARLTAQTNVTVHGHVIGTWIPAGQVPSIAVKVQNHLLGETVTRIPEFRPVPKPPKR